MNSIQKLHPVETRKMVRMCRLHRVPKALPLSFGDFGTHQGMKEGPDIFSPLRERLQALVEGSPARDARSMKPVASSHATLCQAQHIATSEYLLENLFPIMNFVRASRIQDFF